MRVVGGEAAPRTAPAVPVEPGPAPRDDVGLADIVRFLEGWARDCWEARRLFVRVLAAALLIALVYALGTGTEYRAQTRILPYHANPLGQGSINGLAGLAGIALPVEGGDVIRPELYPEVANSFAFRSQVATSPIRFSAGTHSYEEYFESVHRPAPFERVRRWARAAVAAVRGGGEAPAPAPGGLARYPESFMETVESMRGRLRTAMDRKTAVITITATMPDPVAAADLAKVTADRLTQEIVTYESKRAAEQARFLAEQQAEAEVRYLASQRALAEFQDRNRSLSSAVAQTELHRLENDFALATDLFQSLTRQLQAAQVKVKEDTPVLTVLDPSIIPNRPSSPRWGLLLGLAVVVSALGTALYVASRRLAALYRPAS